MGKIRPGNKLNSYLNGEWATHVRKKGGPIPTSGLRRAEDKRIIRLELGEMPYLYYEEDWENHHPDSPWYKEPVLDKPVASKSQKRKKRGIKRRKWVSKYSRYHYPNEYYQKFMEARTHKLRNITREQAKNLFKPAA